jgi:hypothetical protein
LPAGAGLDFAGGETVLRPQQRAGDQGRSGIGLELARRVEGPDDIEIGGHQRQRVFRKPRLQHPCNAGQPFAAAARLFAGEIVAPGAGMGVDDAKRGLLFLQIGQHAHQHDVLDDIGKAAGVKRRVGSSWRGVTTSGRGK